MAFTINCMMNEEDREYLQRCASIRHTSVTSLCEKLLETIAQDQMVLAVLDDDSQPFGRPFHYRKDQAG